MLRKLVVFLIHALGGRTWDISKEKGYFKQNIVVFCDRVWNCISIIVCQFDYLLIKA